MASELQHPTAPLCKAFQRLHRTQGAGKSASLGESLSPVPSRTLRQALSPHHGGAVWGPLRPLPCETGPLGPPVDREAKRPRLRELTSFPSGQMGQPVKRVQVSAVSL